MIGYVTLGTQDFDAATAFYDALFETLGCKRQFSTPRLVVWGGPKGGPMLGVCKPFDGEASSVGNGVMIALNVADIEAVDAVYAKAIALGGRDAGPPGPRGESGFYAGYFRDLDGNKLNAYVL